MHVVWIICQYILTQQGSQWRPLTAILAGRTVTLQMELIAAFAFALQTSIEALLCSRIRIRQRLVDALLVDTEEHTTTGRWFLDGRSNVDGLRAAVGLAHGSP